MQISTAVFTRDQSEENTNIPQYVSAPMQYLCKCHHRSGNSSSSDSSKSINYAVVAGDFFFFFLANVPQQVQAPIKTCAY